MHPSDTRIALEELIKTNSSGKRQPRNSDSGRKRSSASRSSASSGGKAPALAPRGGRGDAALTLPPARGAGSLGSKIILSNLPTDVTEGQVRELFTSSLGPVKKVAMNYRQNGVSTGTCTVIFARAEDGQKAYEQYNNRLIDGKRPLRVEVVVDLAKLPTSRALAPAPVPGRNPRSAASTRGARRGARGSSSSSSGPSNRSAPRPKKTLEDLDAEMEDYAKAGADAGTSA